MNLYSNSCSGKNRNLYAERVYLHFLTMDLAGKPMIKIRVTNQKLSQLDHTHLTADINHAIKKEKNIQEEIDLPRDWTNLIHSVSSRQPINGLEMEQGQFVNFKTLLTRKTKCLQNPEFFCLQIFIP